MSSFRHPSIVFGLLVFLLAACLRFYRIDYQSYWHDEGNSLSQARRDPLAILRNAAADIHPPGYYLAISGWRALLGESEFGLRSFSAFVGVALVAVVYRLGRALFDAPAALAATLFAAVNPFLIYYAQEARMYSLLALASAASFWFFEMWMRPSGPRGWKLAARYCLATAIGLYTHYAFGFVIIAQNLIAAFRWLSPSRTASYAQRTPQYARWLGLQALTLLLFLPWLPTAYHQLTNWPAAREFPEFGDALLNLARYLAFGRTLTTQEVLWGLAIAAVLLLVGVWQGGLRRAWLPLGWLLAPAALTLALGLLTESFSKFLLVAVPPVCLLWGAAFHSQRGARLASLGSWALGIGILVFTFFSLGNLYFNPLYFRDDYRGIARYLHGLQRTGDAVLLNAPNQYEVFTYYHHPEQGDAPLFPIPMERPPDKARTEQELSDIAAGAQRLFVLFWADQQADPDRIVENWLNTHAFKADDAWFGQVRLATYAVARTAAEMTTPVEARFSEHITLAGYTLASASALPGDILQVTFFWRTDAPLPERYKVFVHLYADVNAPPLSQHDGEPGGGLSLTTDWEPGITYADNHGIPIPADAPPGTYRLMVGVYNVDRLPAIIGDRIVGDRLDLGDITIR